MKQRLHGYKNLRKVLSSVLPCKHQAWADICIPLNSHYFKFSSGCLGRPILLGETTGSPNRTYNTAFRIPASFSFWLSTCKLSSKSKVRPILPQHRKKFSAVIHKLIQLSSISLVFPSFLLFNFQFTDDSWYDFNLIIFLYMCLHILPLPLLFPSFISSPPHEKVPNFTFFHWSYNSVQSETGLQGSFL